MFTLQGVNPSDYDGKFKPVAKPSVVKSDHEVLKFGQISDTSGNGTKIRVYKCNGRKVPGISPYHDCDGQNCFWDRHPIDGKAVGLPLKVDDGFIHVWGFFCSYSCAYSYIVEHNEKMPIYRKPMFRNTLTLLKQMFETEFPDETLEPANPWVVLNRVGFGSMNIKTFRTTLKGLFLQESSQFSVEPVTTVYNIKNRKTLFIATKRK